MYEVQAERFPEPCVSHGASVAPHTLGCAGPRCEQDQARGALGWDKGLHLLLLESQNHSGRKRCCSELQLLCRNDLFYSHIVTEKPLRTGLGRGRLHYCEGMFSQLQI